MQLFKIYLPRFLYIILLAIPFASLNFTDYWMFVPNIPIMYIFFFSIFRPKVLPMYMVFIFGLMADLAYRLPLGSFSFALVLLGYLLLQKRYIFFGRSLPLIWSGFALFALIFYVIQALQVTILTPIDINLEIFSLNLGITILCYGIFHVFFLKILDFSDKIAGEKAS